MADASSPQVDVQVEAVRGVLAELGVEDKDALLVLNKIDRLPDQAARDRVLARYPHAIAISAREGTGLATLARAASDSLGRSFRDVDVETNPGNGRLLAWLGSHGEVLSRQFTADRVIVHCRIPAALLGRINPAEATVVSHVEPPRGPMVGSDRTETAESPPAAPVATPG